MGNDSLYVEKGRKRQELGCETAGIVVGTVAKLMRWKRNLVGEGVVAQVGNQLVEKEHNLPSQCQNSSLTSPYDLTDK